MENPRDVRDALSHALDPAHKGAVLVDLVTDPNALSMPPHISRAEVEGFALATTRIVLDGGVGRMLEMAETNLRTMPVP